MSSPISETAVSLPAPALRPFVRSYAGFRAAGLPPGLHFGLPSSDIDLIVSLQRPIDILRMPNSTQQPSAFSAIVCGLQDAPAIIRNEGHAFGVHVFIKPLGVRAILGIASAEISSRVLDFSAVWASAAADLIEMLHAASTWQQRFAILDRVFLSRLGPARQHREVEWAWRRLAASHGSLAIQDLADEIGWSRRHFTGSFRDAVGVTPKGAARVFRFQRACRLIADQRPALAHVANACGYYDQAHLTREWNAFAGCSPKVWIARDLPFLQDYELGSRDNDCDDSESESQPYLPRAV